MEMKKKRLFFKNVPVKMTIEVEMEMNGKSKNFFLLFMHLFFNAKDNR